MPRIEPGGLAVITGTHVYNGCVCAVKCHYAGVICMAVLANGHTVAVSYDCLTPVSMEQIDAGEVEFTDPATAKEQWQKCEVCTCRRRMPRWKIGDQSG